MDRYGLFGAGVGSLSEQEVQEALADITPHLWGVVVNTFDDLLERRATDRAFTILDEGQSAQWLRPQIIHRARRVFEFQDAMRFYVVRQQALFEYKDSIAICFKKVTSRWYKPLRQRRLERSNYLTTQNMDFWQQLPIPGFPNVPRVIIGYEFLREMTDVRVLVGFPRTRRKNFLWVYEMQDQNQALIRLEEQYRAATGFEDDEDDPGFVVRPRRKRSEGTADE